MDRRCWIAIGFVAAVGSGAGAAGHPQTSELKTTPIWHVEAGG